MTSSLLWSSFEPRRFAAVVQPLRLRLDRVFPAVVQDGEDARRRGERVRTTKWVIEGWDLEAGRGLTSDENLPLLFERRGLRDPRESWAARVRRPS